VLVALSGGVDSSVAAWKLHRDGWNVDTAYIRTWLNESELGDCPATEDIETAAAAADSIGVPFRIINLVQEYREKVVSYLVNGYKSGITPNPDIMCNREMKFGVFRAIAASEGYTHIATGHYCRIVYKKGGEPTLHEGMDPNKDQSYFLTLTRREDFRNVLFPVGEMTKGEVRQLAGQAGLPNAEKKDSQGICFLGKVKIDEFLAQYIEDQPGPIVTVDGRTLGMHKGLHSFTIGQRRGIGVPSNTDNEAFVVVAKNYQTNSLVVGFDRPGTPLLYQKTAHVVDLNWLAEPVSPGEELLAKPRYRDSKQNVVITRVDDSSFTVTFAKSQRALAKGQVLSLYRGTQLIGGGVYDSFEHISEDHHTSGGSLQ